MGDFSTQILLNQNLGGQLDAGAAAELQHLNPDQRQGGAYLSSRRGFEKYLLAMRMVLASLKHLKFHAAAADTTNSWPPGRH